MNPSPFGSAQVLAFSLLATVATACGGTDPNQLMGRGSTSSTEPPTESDMASAAFVDKRDAAPPPTNTAAPSGSASADAGLDAPGPQAAPMVDPFQGAPAFIAKVGPSTRDPGHVFPGNTPTNNPAGKACGNCHGFVLSGTVFRDAAGTIPADRVEVRARDANGAAVSAWTDQDGNFFVPRTANIALPVTVAVRDAARTTPMLAKIANGTCASASCHVPAKEGPIHLP